ncbi:MAG: helix-turn-helix domain-containing protein [Bryobacterales bacterium]|nr:helix-turn-helix domain-containing protein [Bryobacterales bacterium]
MKLLTPAQVAELTQIAEQTLAHYRSAGTGPPYLKFGGHVRYRVEDLDDWIARQVQAQQREHRPVLIPLPRSKQPTVRISRKLGGRPKRQGVQTNRSERQEPA